MFEQIKENQVLITLLFSGIVMLSTIVYAVLTRNLVKETKLMRKSQYEPYILFYLSTAETTTGCFILNVLNIGQGVAKDVKFEILEDPMLNNKKMIDVPFFSKGLRHFPPQKNYKHTLGSMQDMTIDELLSRNLVVDVSYKDIFLKKYKETFLLSFSDVLDGKFTPPETYIGMISHNLEKIDKSIKELSSIITEKNSQ